MKSTNELDQLHIPYELRRHGEASYSAIEAAEALGLPVGSIIKTLILVGQTIGPTVVLVPGNKRLNLAELRAELNDKTVHLASHEQTLAISGYEVGSVTPFGLDHTLPIYIDDGVSDERVVAISAGDSGVDLLITSANLRQATSAIVLPPGCFTITSL